MKTLIAVESPHKAKVIQGFLGSNYIVLPTVGHFKEMPMPKNMTPAQREKYGEYAMDLKNNFEPLFKTMPGSTKIVKAFKDALKTVDEVVIGTDSDNEGALIGFLLVEELKAKVPVYRATWNEITERAVSEGLSKKEKIDVRAKKPEAFISAANSALTRGSWDRLYGFATSPYVWRTIKPGGSSGRVQTPGARLVVERELERLAFKSVNYYSIHGTFDGVKAKLVKYNGKKVAGSGDIDDEGKLKDGVLLITDENLNGVIADLESKGYVIGDVKQKPYKRSAPPPFMTSSALQSIGGKTGMSSKQITAILQKHYMNGDVTYIRTVSVEAAPEAIEAARKSLTSLYGKQYVSQPANEHKDKKQENSGHECIRPTLDDKKELLVKSFADSKEQTVFDLIYRRMLASQAIACTGTTWTMIVDSEDKKATFSASETEIHEPGWTKVYSSDEDNEDN